MFLLKEKATCYTLRISQKNVNMRATKIMNTSSLLSLSSSFSSVAFFIYRYWVYDSELNAVIHKNIFKIAKEHKK